MSKQKSQLSRHEVSNSWISDAILGFWAVLELSVIQSVFVLPHLRVQLINQHNVFDLTWQLQ